MKIEGQSFVVTGGCGFIGANLVKDLVNRGAGEVRVLDKELREASLGDAQASGRVKLYKVDVTRPQELLGPMKGAQGLFHMAVLPLGPSNTDLRMALDINVVGGFNVYDAAVQGGIQKVVYSSASSVYGDTDAVVDESHPLNTVNMYGATKLTGELLLRAFATHKGLGYVILRYMNVYGPGQTGGLINAVINRLRQNQPPLVFGLGNQSFDYVHVSDIVQANIAAMASEVSGEAFNVGGDEEFSVLQIIGILQKLMGTDMKPEFRPAPSGDVGRRVGSSQKARRMLGYQPSVPFSEGLRQLVGTGARA
ncbi:MAG: NAD-dependent epimerase/dehydratase family protein [Chloroflexi bacterium]|nr:NAD-dependent epimerase/dehydratase family protein [Chloroflexota bacterium]